MSDISPLSTSFSSVCLSRLSQFLQLSHLTGAIFQFSPSGEHAEQLNNFSIYMHGGIQYHSHALGHFRADKHTRRGHDSVQTSHGSSHTPSMTTCNQCQDQAQGIQMLLHTVGWFCFRLLCRTLQNRQY